MADSAKAKEPINTVQPQPPNLKTWVLKASIHCEGCKKKVMKILHDTPGVHSSDVDVKQQKVTVTGSIDVNALITKLIKKTGKHAELWPQIQTEQKEKKQIKPKPKRKPQLSEKIDAEAVKKNEDEFAKEKSKAETTVTDAPEKSASEEGQKTAAVKSTPTAPSGSEGSGVVKGNWDKEVKQPSENKPEEKIARAAAKEAAAEDAQQKTVREKVNAAMEGAANDGASDYVDKKKKTKGQNGKQKFEARERSHGPDATEATESQYHYNPPNHSPPRNFPAHMYGNPPTYHAPPVYTVSYNTTPSPSSSYGASYYAMPPHHTQGYAYPGSEAEYQPSDSASYQSQPSDTSFQMFSDENPNACSLM